MSVTPVRSADHQPASFLGLTATSSRVAPEGVVFDTSETHGGRQFGRDDRDAADVVRRVDGGGDRPCDDGLQDQATGNRLTRLDSTDLTCLIRSARASESGPVQHLCTGRRQTPHSGGRNETGQANKSSAQAPVSGRRTGAVVSRHEGLRWLTGGFMGRRLFRDLRAHQQKILFADLLSEALDRGGDELEVRGASFRVCRASDSPPATPSVR